MHWIIIEIDKEKQLITKGPKIDTILPKKWLIQLLFGFVLKWMQLLIKIWLLHEIAIVPEFDPTIK